MDTLADVLARGRDRDGPVIDAPDRAAPYSYDEFCTNAWKAGNLLRYYGVRPDATMAVLIGPKEPGPNDEPGRMGTAADPLVAVLGGASLGATVDLTPAQPIDARAVVLPSGWIDRYEVGPGCSRLAWGGPPENPDVAHFERELWSENPIEPPDPVAPDDPFLEVGGKTHTQGEVLAAGEKLAEEHGLGVGDAVGIDAALADPGAFVAGVVAPLAVGATILPVDASADEDREVTYVVRAAGPAPDERTVVDPADVIL